LNFAPEYAVNCNFGFSTVPLSPTSSAIVLPFAWIAFVSVPLFTSCSFHKGPKSIRNSRDLRKSKEATGFKVPPKE